MSALLVAVVMVMLAALTMVWRRWSRPLRARLFRTADALQVLGRLTRVAPRTATPAPEHRWAAPPPAPPEPARPGRDGDAREAHPGLVFDDLGPGDNSGDDVVPAAFPGECESEGDSDSDGGDAGAGAGDRRFRPRVALVAAGCAVLIAGGTATAVAAAGSGGGHSPSPAPPPVPGGPTANGPPATPAPSTSTSTSRPPTRTARRRIARPLPVRPGQPVVTSMSPGSGVTGQAVTLTGAGLYSSNGVITVRFGAVVASTVCPSQNICQVTVPALVGVRPGTALPVTVTTDKGTSHALAFRYG